MLDSIDEAIERTEAVVAATERLRDALLHELLTRGVPGWHTEWKDVAGVGTMPAGWEVARLREGVHLTSGASPNYTTEHDGSIPVLGANGRIGWTDQSNATRGVAVGRVGASGSVRRIQTPVWLSDNVLHVKANVDKWENSFLYRALAQAGLPNLASKTAQPLITQTELGGVRVARPPLAEQRAIAAVLDGVDEAAARGTKRAR